MDVVCAVCSGRPGRGNEYSEKNRPVHAAALCLYNSGTAALVVYMALRGILKIAGATSSYVIIIGVAGAVMIAAGTVMKMLIIKK